VMADRYAFTAFARDVTRGVDRQWVRNLYSFALMPDIALYFSVPLDIAVERITSSRAKIKYYEAGMDLGLSDNKVTSFRLFQQMIIDEYEKMIPEFGLIKIDGTIPVQKQQKLVRQVVKNGLKDWQGIIDPSIKPSELVIPDELEQAHEPEEGGEE
jgi:dTMP kinase